MAEFVCEVVTEHELVGDVHHYVRRERVVRCRDCAMSQRLGRVLYCMRPLDGGGCSKVTEDGFCAWGKEREA